jgi:dUTP pyrophosphatase
MEIKVLIKRLYEDCNIPKRAYKNDGAFDIYLPNTVSLKKGEIKKVNLGIRINLPDGFDAYILPRSSLYKRNVIQINAPGLVDNGYTGELSVILQGLKDNVLLKKGERICQLKIVKQHNCSLVEIKKQEVTMGEMLALMDVFEGCKKRIDQVADTERGSNGSGSSGK